METTRPYQSEIIAEAGALLFGERWCAPLARAIEVDVRVLRLVKAAAAAGRPWPVGPGVMQALRLLMQRRPWALKRLIDAS